MGKWMRGVAGGLLLGAAPGAECLADPLDSLRALVATAPPDTTRVLLLDELCWQLSQTDLDAAQRYGREGLRLARRLRYRRGEAKCLNDLGNAATLAGDLPAATTYYQQALRAFRALRLAQGEVYALNGLGNAALQEQALARATAHYEAALPIARRLDEPGALALTLNNLGNVRALRQLDEPARVAAAEARRLYHELGNTLGEATALATLGQVAYHARRLAEADSLLRASAALHRANGADFQLVGVLHTLGLLELDMRRPAEALAAAREALALAERIGAPVQAAHAAEVAADATEQLGQLGQSVAYYRKLVALNDSVLSLDKREALARLQVRFDVAGQQARIRALRQQQRLTRLEADRQQTRSRALAAVAGVLVAALLGTGLLVARLRKQRARLTASETALRQANRTKEQVLSIVGHDLRTPMAGFQHLGPLLQDLADHPDPAEQRALADALTRQARHVGALLDNLLDWARAQAGTVAVRKQPVHLAALVRGVAELYAPVAAAKNIRLQVAIADAVIDNAISTDPALLAAILRNLTANAVKFTPPGKTVTLAVAHRPEGIWVEVADTGVGMTPDQLRQALGSATAPSTRGTAGEAGTGLGLPVCVRFAALLGANLTAESTPGHGTTWRLTLAYAK